MKDDRPFDASKDLKTEYRGESKLGKKVTCLPCGEVVFELPEEPTVRQREEEGLRLAAHLEFSHDMVVRRGRCSDPSCEIFHVEAFAKGQEPAT